MPDICVCDWRYSLTLLNSLLPSALSSPDDLSVLCFLSLENYWRSKTLLRVFTFLSFMELSVISAASAISEVFNWKPNYSWNLNSVSFSPRELQYCNCKTSYYTVFHQTHCTSWGPFISAVQPLPPWASCLYSTSTLPSLSFLVLSCLSSPALLQLASPPPQPIGPPVQQDHDA